MQSETVFVPLDNYCGSNKGDFKEIAETDKGLYKAEMAPLHFLHQVFRAMHVVPGRACLEPAPRIP